MLVPAGRGSPCLLVCLAALIQTTALMSMLQLQKRGWPLYFAALLRHMYPMPQSWSSSQHADGQTLRPSAGSLLLPGKGVQSA